MTRPRLDPEKLTAAWLAAMEQLDEAKREAIAVAADEQGGFFTTMATLPDGRLVVGMAGVDVLVIDRVLIERDEPGPVQ